MSIGSWFARKLASAAPARKDSVPDTTPLATKPNTHFERYRTLIDSFDEDRETVLEKILRWVLLLLAYALAA